jgi:quercetin dioxygenase-like cupin family protein
MLPRGAQNATLNGSGRTTMAQAHAASGDIVDIRPLGAALPQHRTAAILKAEQLELLRIVLQAGQTLKQHSAPGEITVLCLEGEIEFSTSSGIHLMLAGQLIHLAAGEPHSLTAHQPASALVTMCLIRP